MFTETGSVVLTVSLAVGLLLLLVLVIASLMCCAKKSRPVKRYEEAAHAAPLHSQPPFCWMRPVVFSCCVSLCRCFQSSSGQSNPLFQSGSARGSPRLGPSHISQPVFVESSASRACKPLFSSRPAAAALKPSRAAPEVSLSSGLWS